MKIYAVRNGKFSRSNPLANVPLFGYQGGSIGIADNGWIIRDKAGRHNKPFDWSMVPSDVDRIAYCIGKLGNKWEWSFLVRDISCLTKVERKREEDRWNKLTSENRARYSAMCDVITQVEALDEAEKNRLFRMKPEGSSGSRTRDIYETIVNNVKQTDIEQAQYPKDEREMNSYVEFYVNFMKKAFAMLAKYAPEELPQGVSVPTGKHSVKGKVLSAKWVSNSRFGGSMKMLVKLESGVKVWGTAPMTGSEIDRGDHIEFTATFSQSDDPTFGFFKRPKITRHVKDNPTSMNRKYDAWETEAVRRGFDSEDAYDVQRDYGNNLQYARSEAF